MALGGENIGQAFVTIRPDTATFETGMKSSIGRVAKMIGGLFAARAVGQFFVGAIKEAEEAERVTKQTNAVIKSTGGIAGVTAKHVGKLADKFSELSGADDEAIQASQNWLLTFKNIKNVGAEKTFDRTAKAAVELAATMAAKGGGKTADSLAGATTMLGKALNDPIAGMAALQRAGVTLSEQQKNQVRAHMAVGDILGAQKIILQEVESQTKGSALANRTATDQMKVAWENLKESIGTVVLPIFQKVVDKLVPIVGWLKENKAAALGLALAISVTLAAAFLGIVGPAVAAGLGMAAAMWPVLAALGAILGAIALVKGALDAIQGHGALYTVAQKLGIAGKTLTYDPNKIPAGSQLGKATQQAQWDAMVKAGKKAAKGAKGAIITRPTWAMIGEAGPEALIPLDRMEGASPLPALTNGTRRAAPMLANTLILQALDPRAVATLVAREAAFAARTPGV